MYTETDLNKLIQEVTTEFTAHLAKAEESFNLAKSEDKSDEKKDESKEEPKKPMEHEKEEDKGIKDQHQQDTSSKEGEVEMPASEA